MRWKFDNGFAIVVFIFTVLSVAGIANLAYSITNLAIRPISEGRLPAQEQEIVQLKTDVATLSRQVSRLQELLDRQPLGDGGSAPPDITALAANMADVQSRLRNLESAVLDDPTKLLAVPIIRKDLDNLKESTQSSQLGLRQEFERVYDISKSSLNVAITGLVAIIVGVVGLLAAFIGAKVFDTRVAPPS